MIIATILIFLLFFIFTMYVIEIETHNAIFVLFVIVVFWLIFSAEVYDKGYKSGQINYANGNIEYELVRNSRGELIWDSKGDK